MEETWSDKLGILETGKGGGFKGVYEKTGKCNQSGRGLSVLWGKIS